MMERIKKDLTMLRYGYGFKGNLIACLIYLALGLGMVLLLGSGFFLGYFFCLMGPMFLMQAYSANNMTLMVQASPRRKAMQTTAICLYGGVSVLTCYLILACVTYLQYRGILPHFGHMPQVGPAVLF